MNETTLFKIMNAVFSGLTVVLIGVVLLLNTTEILSWKVWGAFVFLWPLFIVLAGIQVMFGHYKFGKILGAFATFVIFVTIFAYGYANHQKWNDWDDLKDSFIFVRKGD